MEYDKRHADAAPALLAWYAEADSASWGSMDIEGNHYRLIVAYDFLRKSLFIKWFGTHAEYDKIDVATVELTK